MFSAELCRLGFGSETWGFGGYLASRAEEHLGAEWVTFNLLVLI